MSGWRAVNLLFLVSTVLESLATGHLTAFTPLLLAELGLSGDEVGLWTGLLFGAMMAVAFPLAPFWGALAERYSRRLIIVRSQYLAAAAAPFGVGAALAVGAAAYAAAAAVAGLLIRATADELHGRGG